ncbi:MAG TPA: TolC family protein [Patescibacteria group bacterium]|nr:TolC family protein [Patescibacteria group bacterium]
MMTPSKYALVLAIGLAWPATRAGAAAQEQPPTPPPVEETGPPPVSLSLADAIQMSLKNNLDIKIAKVTPQIREQDEAFQEAAFDPNLGFSATYQDNSRPSSNVFDVGAQGTLVSIDSKVQNYQAGISDRFRYGASYSANLDLTSFTSNSANAVFPTTYQASLDFVYNQSLLRNRGREVNETQIVIAQNNQAIGKSQFRQQVLDTLKATEDAYWELVFARQNLDVSKEALGLAGELLKLNKIKVQVGTLPPIEITQADAEVASREQGVIVAENAVSDAEDNLRRVMNMPKDGGSWDKPIAPSDEPLYVERPVDLPRELETAVSHRPDLEQARLNTKTSDSRLAFDRNQLKWDLGLRATYTLAGLAGDSGDFLTRVATACADDGVDGIPATGDPGEGDGICEGAQPATGSNPAGPGETLTFGNLLLAQGADQGFADALKNITGGDFPSWSVSLFLGIPLGNRSAEASYSGSRLAKEQSEIRYENALLNAEVQVRTAARAIVTGKKRIDAAEKNVELQRKKVEAEQKKFENGMSTSFQVLTFQNDLITALGTKNRALVDYRKALSALEQAKGTLDDYLKVNVQ